MIGEAYTAAELVAFDLSGLPTTERRMRDKALRDSWPSRPRAGRGGGREYLFSGLPLELQVAILSRQGRALTPAPLPPAGEGKNDALTPTSLNHPAVSTHSSAGPSIPVDGSSAAGFPPLSTAAGVSSSKACNACSGEDADTPSLRYLTMDQGKQQGVTSGRDRDTFKTLTPTPLPQVEGKDGAFTYDPAQLQDWYARQPASKKRQAERRLAVVLDFATALRAGLSRQAALTQAAERHQVPVATLEGWWYGRGRPGCRLYERQDWLAALCPGYPGRVVFAEVDPRLFDFFCGQYLNRRQPTWADAYRRTQEIAQARGWPLASLETLRRKLRREVPRVQVRFLREGHEALRDGYPSARMDYRTLHCGQIVVGDGLKFDRLWIAFADGEVLNTTTAWVYQDQYSGKLLAHRAGKTESTELFRLTTYDLVAVCLPETLRLDNTRVAANKAMTAGAKGRKRFKDQDLDPTGHLPSLGIDVQFTDPDTRTHNPASKSVERSFGTGGLHEAVANHPSFIDRGFSRETAIPFPEFSAVLDAEVTRFNARPGRTGGVCGGRSFDQVWAEGLTHHPVKRASEALRRRLLLMPEVVMANRKTGEITLSIGRGPQGDNRYWNEALPPHAGRKLLCYYDPKHLHDTISVYGLDERFIADVPCTDPLGFGDADAKAEWQKNKQRWLKAQRAAAAAAVRMEASERAALYEASAIVPADETPGADSVGAHGRAPVRAASQSPVVVGAFGGERVGAHGRAPVRAASQSPVKATPERAIHESSLQEPRIITQKAEGGTDDAFIRAVNALAKARGL